MTKPDRLYLDHAATTPVLPEARAAMADALERWANPSSPHADGRSARGALENARRIVAEALGWRHDVIFTSGATEAVAIVGARARRPGRILGATEHEAVVAAMGAEAIVAPVDRQGVVDEAALAETLDRGPALVAIQLVNNETGVIQPLDRIAERVRAAGSLLLADCAQSAGKLPLPQADFIAVSAHKLGGPPGVGALLVRDMATLAPSGGQEKGYRRGTENLPGAVGLASALATGAFRDAMPRFAELRRRLEEAIAAAGGGIVAPEAPRSPAIGAYVMPGVAGASQLVQFDLAGISVSAGSACSSGSMKVSRVHQAMDLSPDVAGCVVRVSFGPATGEADVDRFVGEWRRIRDQAAARAA